MSGIALQRCATCGKLQYPPRDLCGTCLAATLTWETADHAEGKILATTELHHSHDAAFRFRLPLRIGLVQLDADATAVCFLDAAGHAGAPVRVTAAVDSAGRTVLFAATKQGES